MEWILNDLSLEKAYTNLSEFADDLLKLLKVRASSSQIKSSLLCNRGLGQVEVSHGISFIKAVQKTLRRDERQLLLVWLDHNGPFWTDDREFNQDDYFEYQGTDVTDRGLGECSRRVINDKQITSVSMGKGFLHTPLDVTHGIEDSPIATINVHNVWTRGQLKKSLTDAEKKPTSWQSLLEISRERYSNLIFSEDLLTQISSSPFNTCVADRFFDLCSALEKVIKSRDEGRSFTGETHQLVEKFFHGDKAWFSDETDNDKRDFRDRLKFKDCHDGEWKTFTFHGKIKTPQTRVYFEWPLTPDMEKIQIVYFGPKITKH